MFKARKLWGRHRGHASVTGEGAIRLPACKSRTRMRLKASKPLAERNTGRKEARIYQSFPPVDLVVGEWCPIY